MPREYTPRVPCVCFQCGAAFAVIPSRFARGEVRYCSHACLAVGKTTHGDTRKFPATNGAVTPEYRAWRGIKTRCLNTKDHGYPRYGGRGITVCERWRDNFAAFLADVGRRPSPLHSIDRIDPNGNYEPGNVRWSTVKEQAQNRNSTRLVTCRGVTQCLSEWSVQFGIDKVTLRDRLERGWDAERAITTPVRGSSH